MTKQPLQSLINHQLAGVDVASVMKSVVNRLVFSVGKDDIMVTTRDWFHATASMTRDRLIPIHFMWRGRTDVCCWSGSRRQIGVGLYVSCGSKAGVTTLPTSMV